MRQIDVRGVIVQDKDLRIYNLFKIDAVAPKIVRAALKEANGEPVEVLINSGGGDVFAGTEIYTILREYRGKVHIKIQSIAASAAAVISQAGESEMSPTAQLMIHNVSSYASGDNRAMGHKAEVLTNANKAIAAAFVAKSGKSEGEILELMAKETWFTAEQAVEAGLVDRIMFAANTSNNPVQLVACHSGLLPANVIEYFNSIFDDQAKAEKAKAEYEFLLLEGKTR